MPPIIDRKLCVKCHRCTEICPLDIFETDGEGYPLVRYPEECWHCYSCVFDCPRKAVSLRLPLPASILYVEAPGKGNGAS